MNLGRHPDPIIPPTQEGRSIIWAKTAWATYPRSYLKEKKFFFRPSVKILPGPLWVYRKGKWPHCLNVRKVLWLSLKKCVLPSLAWCWRRNASQTWHEGVVYQKWKSLPPHSSSQTSVPGQWFTASPLPVLHAELAETHWNYFFFLQNMMKQIIFKSAMVRKVSCQKVLKLQ